MLKSELKAFYAINKRELLKFARQKSRLITDLSRPIIWLLFVGYGISTLVKLKHGSYIDFIFPGILVMTVLFRSIFSAISIIWDRQFGVLKEILVSPVSRKTFVYAKITSGSIISTSQALLILIFAPFFGINLTIGMFLLTLVALFLISSSITAFGILIASRMTSFEGFNSIINLIVQPMFFVSGALYPIKKFPLFLKILAYVNPITYSVDLLKYIFFYNKAKSIFVPEISILISLIFLILFLVSMVISANYFFEKEEN
jgi:ABC-2 type transport system permease protein